MSTQHTFIQIIGRGENDYVTYNEIFTYNKKSNQFRVVKSFNDRSSYAEEIVTANKKGITVKHRVQPMETGEHFERRSVLLYGKNKENFR